MSFCRTRSTASFTTCHVWFYTCVLVIRLTTAALTICPRSLLYIRQYQWEQNHRLSVSLVWVAASSFSERERQMGDLVIHHRLSLTLSLLPLSLSSRPVRNQSRGSPRALISISCHDRTGLGCEELYWAWLSQVHVLYHLSNWEHLPNGTLFPI